MAKANRRRFTQKHNRKVVREAGGCPTLGAAARWGYRPDFPARFNAIPHA